MAFALLQNAIKQKFAATREQVYPKAIITNIFRFVELERTIGRKITSIDDYLYIVAGAWNGKRTYHKLKVHYDKKDYVLFHGYKCPLDEFIRT